MISVKIMMMVLLLRSPPFFPLQGPSEKEQAEEVERDVALDPPSPKNEASNVEFFCFPDFVELSCGGIRP